MKTIKKMLKDLFQITLIALAIVAFYAFFIPMLVGPERMAELGKRQDRAAGIYRPDAYYAAQAKKGIFQ